MKKYLPLIIAAIYTISPIDLLPGPVDDIILDFVLLWVQFLVSKFTAVGVNKINENLPKGSNIAINTEEVANNITKQVNKTITEQSIKTRKIDNF